MLNKTAPMKTRDLVMVSLLTALIVVLALVPPIPVPLVPVPVTLQTLGVMLAGLVLGPARAGLAAPAAQPQEWAHATVLRGAAGNGRLRSGAVRDRRGSAHGAARGGRRHSPRRQG